MISPYGRNGQVIPGLNGTNPAATDYGSALKFVEHLYSLPALTSVNEDATDLAPFFDFTTKKNFVPVHVKTPFDRRCVRHSSSTCT